MEINFNSPKKIIIQQEKSKNIDKLTVIRVVDLPKQKLVKCFCEELDEPLVLWEKDSYDTIGQWSDHDVRNRLIDLFNS